MTTVILLLAATIILGGLYALWRARQDGRAVAKLEAAEQENEHARERRQIDESVARLGAGELDERLRKYQRD